MKNLHEFIQELRLVTSDIWGTPLDTHFEVAGHLHNRGVEIPSKWEYSPGMGEPTEPDNYFYELFENTSTELLLEIGEFLFRYLIVLDRAGKSY